MYLSNTQLIKNVRKSRVHFSRAEIRVRISPPHFLCTYGYFRPNTIPLVVGDFSAKPVVHQVRKGITMLTKKEVPECVRVLVHSNRLFANLTSNGAGVSDCQNCTPRSLNFYSI